MDKELYDAIIAIEEMMIISECKRLKKNIGVYLNKHKDINKLKKKCLQKDLEKIDSILFRVEYSLNSKIYRSEVDKGE